MPQLVESPISDVDGSTPETLAETSRKILEEISLRSGSLRGLGLGFGRSNMWLWRQVRFNKRLDQVKIFQILDRLGIPPRFYFHEILDKTPSYDPVWLLAYLANGAADPASAHPFVQQFRLCVEPLLSLRSTSGAAETSAADGSEPLVSGWHVDSPAAQTKLEKQAIFLARNAAESAIASRQVSRSALKACTRAILLWSEMRLAAGHFSDAADGLAAGNTILRRFPNLELAGDFFIIASDLLLRLGHLHHAHRLAQEALQSVQALRAPHRRKALLQLGTVLRHLGRCDEARLQAIAALRIPSPDRSLRCRAWFELAKTACRQGKDRHALGLLRSAKRHSSPQEPGHAVLCWWEGVLVGRLDRFASKFVRPFSAALKGFRKSRQSCLFFLVAADLVELLGAKKPKRALSVVRQLTPELSSLDEAVQDLWLDLAALILRGDSPAAFRAHLELFRDPLRAAVFEPPPPVGTSARS